MKENDNHLFTEDEVKERMENGRALLGELLYLLMTYLHHAIPANPGDPAAARAFARLDQLRRAIDDEAGRESEPIPAPARGNKPPPVQG